MAYDIYSIVMQDVFDKLIVLYDRLQTDRVHLIGRPYKLGVDRGSAILIRTIRSVVLVEVYISTKTRLAGDSVITVVFHNTHDFPSIPHHKLISAVALDRLDFDFAGSGGVDYLIECVARHITGADLQTQE